MLDALHISRWIFIRLRTNEAKRSIGHNIVRSKNMGVREYHGCITVIIRDIFISLSGYTQYPSTYCFSFYVLCLLLQPRISGRDSGDTMDYQGRTRIRMLTYRDTSKARDLFSPTGPQVGMIPHCQVVNKLPSWARLVQILNTRTETQDVGTDSIKSPDVDGRNIQEFPGVTWSISNKTHSL